MKKAVECVICKKCFEKEVGAINRSPRHCCSKECQNKAVSESQRKHEFSPYLLDTKKRATKKNIPYNLTEENLRELFDSQEGKCAITGVPIHIKRYKDTKNIFQASIDRLDNTKGYTIDNIQFTSLGANYMRNTFSIEDVKSMLDSIYKVASEHISKSL